MEHNSEILDISSDEEPALDDYDWLSELLDDCDDVVVVGEVNPRPHKSKSFKKNDDSDDDCVILDGDPDNSVAVAHRDVDDSDDLLIVGHKGQIACRDYPHPRHLCAKFPFVSTPHEWHCDQCHCYVCDSLAPCAHWGTGVSSINHCHATDKEEIWKAKRKSFKQAKDAPVPVSKSPDYLNQVRPRNIIRLAPNSIPQNQFSRPNTIPQSQFCRPTTIPQNQFCRPTTIPQNQVSRPTTIPQNQVSRPTTIPQVSRPTTIRACSSTTKFGIPNIISQGRSRQSGFALGKNGFQPRSTLQQPLGVRNNVIQKDRGHNIGNLGPQFVSSNTIVKKSGFVGVGLATNQSAYGSSNNISGAHASQYSRNSVPPATSNDPASNVNCAHASQCSGNPAPPATSNDTNPVGWHGVCPTVDSSYMYQSSCQPNMGSIVSDTVPSQPQVYSQPIPQSNEDQNIYQLRNPSQNATNPGFSDFDFGWLNNTSPSNQQPPVENLQLQDTAATNEPLPVKEFSSQFNTISKLHCNDIEFENWLLENQSVPVISEGAAVPSELNVLFPEHASFDAGMLFFDFETSLNGLTHA